MGFGSFALALFLLAGTTAEVTVVNFPPKGSVSLGLTPSGKLDVERMGTNSQVHIDADKLQIPQKLDPAMNAYVVWAVSPEGAIENIGELAVTDGKAHLDTTTRLDQFGILITAEPHYLVDKPNSSVVFRNGVPKSESIRRTPVTIETGSYDYSKLQPIAGMAPSIVLQARAALQLASAAQADRFAEAEFRLAKIALGTADEMLGRSSPIEIFFPVANESIRRSQRALVMARENKDRAAGHAGTALKLPMDYFDVPKGTVTPAGVQGLRDIAATFKLWINPILIDVPENAVPIVKKFFADSGIPENRIVIVPEP